MTSITIQSDIHDDNPYTVMREILTASLFVLSSQLLVSHYHAKLAEQKQIWDQARLFLFPPLLSSGEED